MAVQPVDARIADPTPKREPVSPAPVARSAAHSVEHAQVGASFSFLRPSQAGTPAEMGDKGRIVQKVV